jgi:hypothetical protein
MAGFEKLEEAVKHGLRKLTVYQSATGAWHAVALSTHGGGSGGLSALRTASAATEHALDEILRKMSPPAEEKDPFA